MVFKLQGQIPNSRTDFLLEGSGRPEMPMSHGQIKFLLCVLCIYTSIFYTDYVMIRWIVSLTFGDSVWGVLNIILYNTIILFIMFAHYKAVVTDPGYVPLPQNKVDFSDMHTGAKDEDDDSWPVCDKCEIYRPPKANHCKICNRCIRKMDRHSYGINNCVGEENQKYFVQYLFYINLLFTYCLILVVLSVCKDCTNCTTEEIYQIKTLNSSLVGVLCVVFIITASVEFTEQLRSILSGVTKMEQGQKKFSFKPHKPKYLLLAEAFGSYHIVLWFIPCYKGKVKKFNDSLLSHEV